MAARRNRSQAARRAAEHAKRSKAAKKAAATRVRNKRNKERARRREIAKRGWGRRQVNARFDALGKAFKITGQGGHTKWQRMNDLIRNNDPRWLKYYEFMRRAGFSSRRIYDEWFSPSFL